MNTKTYCGLDFHKNVCQLCIMDEKGVMEDPVRIATKKLITFLSNRKHYHIAIESSGGVFDITSKLKELGHQVTIINASQFRAIGITGKKTDRRDAEALATALRLGFVPEVHAKSLYARRVKSLLSSRDLVVQSRTSLTNHIRGILREYGLVIPAGPTAFWKEISKTLAALNCGVMQAVLIKLVDQASQLKAQEKEIEQALSQLTQNDERIKRLCEIPGIGPLGALAFVATVDDVNRFESAHHLASYLGLTPRENSSGKRRQLGGITKCGPELCRRYLIHGSRAEMRYAPKNGRPKRCWADRVEKRCGTNKAVVALAHKNARICFALLRDGTRFGEFKFKKIIKQTPAA